MKIQKKIIITILLSIAILFALLNNSNYAVNETNEETASKNTNTSQEANNTAKQNTQNTSNTANTNSNSNSNNSNTANNTTATKSNNANLSDLGIKPHDFKGFRYGTTSYEVTVPEETESIEVYAKTQDSKATLTGTGKKTLEKGENKLDVEVTAEDGTKKTYTINVIREVVQEGSENGQANNQVEKGEGLAELKINDLNLSPKFSTNVYEYDVKYIGEDNKLNITAEPTNENYVVEIIGNDNLQEGENIITILVSEKNGDNVATYQITVDKSLVDEEAIAKEKEEKAKQQKIIIGSVVAVVIIIAIVVFIVIKRRRSEDLEYDDTYDDYADEEDEEIEVPKALKNKSKNVKKASNDIEEDNEIDSLPKDKLKEKFLNNYSNYEEDYEADYNSPRKKDKPKGKRFKE